MLEEIKKDVTTVAKGVGISFFGSTAGRFLWFLTQVIIARLLGAEIFGLFILGLVALKMSALIAKLGLHTGAMRFVSIYRKDSPEKVKGTLISALSISFFNGLLVCAILYFTADFVATKIFNKPELNEIIKMLAFCVPFLSSMMIVAISSQGFHTTKYKVYIQDLIQPGVNIILVVLIVSINRNIMGVIYAFILSHIVALILGIYIITTRCFPEFGKKGIKPSYNVKELVFYSTPLLVTGFLLFLLSWTDIIMLGIMNSSSSVGIYRAASQISLFMVLVLQASNSIYAPVAAELFIRNEKARLEAIFKTTTRWVFFITFPVSIVIVLSSREIMSIFGPEFINTGSIVLIILTGAQLINCITGGVGYTLMMTGRQKLELLNSLVLVMLNIFLNYLLIPKYGGIGAAIATGISFTAINFLRLAEVYKFYKIHPYNLRYLRILTAGLFAAVLILLIKQSFHFESDFMSLILNSIITGNIFIIFILFGTLSEEDRYVFDSFKKKIGIHLNFKRSLKG